MSTTSSRRDNLTQTTKDGKIELTEQELNRATGGRPTVGSNTPSRLKIHW